MNSHVNLEITRCIERCRTQHTIILYTSMEKLILVHHTSDTTATLYEVLDLGLLVKADRARILGSLIMR